MTRPELVTPVLRVFQRVLFAWQCRRARRNGVARPLAGSITCIQRFGDALNLNLHFHSFLPDGIFSQESDDAPVVFVPLAPPTQGELEILVERLCRRIGKKLTALGAWEPQVEDGVDPERAELGRSTGEQLVAFNPNDRAGLERILRYGLRPPFAEHRLEEGTRGEVYYRLRKPLHDGRSQLLLDPVDLLRRLAAFVPPKGQNLVRYHGVFAPNSKHRETVVRLAARAATHPNPETGRGGAGEDPEQSTSSRTGGQPWEPPSDVRQRRIPWADLLKRVFGHDLTTCPECQGRVEVVAVIMEPAVVRRILDHLGLPTVPPRRGLAHARAPPTGLDGDGPTVDELLTDELPRRALDWEPE